MRKVFPGLLALAAAAGFSVWAYPRLPAEVATHFNIQGDANGWSSRLFASMFAPALGFGLAAVFTVLPDIDPRRANYARFGSTYWTLINAVLVLLAGIHVVVLGKALGWSVEMNQIGLLAIGGLLVLMGNLMTRIRPNWFMGIRTPWSLSSDTVWRRTHRFGGAAFLIAGLCMAASAFIGANWAQYGAMGVLGVAALSSVVYSYVAWRQEQNTPRTGGTDAAEGHR